MDTKKQLKKLELSQETLRTLTARRDNYFGPTVTNVASCCIACIPRTENGCFA